MQSSPVCYLPRRLDAVAFDLDGTLVDSVGELRAALNQVLVGAGRTPLDVATVRRFVGDGVRRLVERAFATTGSPLEGVALDRATDRYVALYEPRAGASPLFPGVAETLAELAGAGVKLGLCTNKPRGATLSLLAGLGLADRFDAISAGDDVASRKPDPAHLRDCLERLGLGADGVAMVGDNELDIAMARAAGVTSVLVTYGYARLALDEIPADARIDDMAALPAALRELGFVLPG